MVSLCTLRSTVHDRRCSRAAGTGMLRVLSIALGVTAFVAQAGPAVAQDSKDLLDANGQMTGRVLAIATVAAAQVAEMRCQRTGWIAAAIKKFDGMGVHSDVNEKQDYADILYFATNILEKADRLVHYAGARLASPGSLRCSVSNKRAKSRRAVHLGKPADPGSLAPEDLNASNDE